MHEAPASASFPASRNAHAPSLPQDFNPPIHLTDSDFAIFTQASPPPASRADILPFRPQFRPAASRARLLFTLALPPPPPFLPAFLLSYVPPLPLFPFTPTVSCRMLLPHILLSLASSILWYFNPLGPFSHFVQSPLAPFGKNGHTSARSFFSDRFARPSSLLYFAHTAKTASLRPLPARPSSPAALNSGWWWTARS